MTERLFADGEARDLAELQQQVRALAKELVSELARLDPPHSRELMSAFVSELVVSVAEQSSREDRRQKQAQGIAAAKARGVRFGRTAKPVPENFDDLHRAWRGGQITLDKAAQACGMGRSTFYNVAVRREQAAQRAV